MKILTYVARVPALGWEKKNLRTEQQARKFLLPKLIDNTGQKPVMHKPSPDAEERPVVGSIARVVLDLEESSPEAERQRNLKSHGEPPSTYIPPLPKYFVGNVAGKNDHGDWIHQLVEVNAPPEKTTAPENVAK